MTCNVFGGTLNLALSPSIFHFVTMRTFDKQMDILFSRS